MNVLITTGIFSPEVGGPATYVPEVVKRLKDKFNFKILTFTTRPNDLFADVPAIPIPKAGGFFARQWGLFQLVLAQRNWVDVIYAQDPLVVGLASTLAGKLLQKKVIVRYGGDPAWEAAFGQGKTKKSLVDFLHQPDGGIKAKVDTALTKVSFSLVDRIITNSQFLKNVVEDIYGISAEKITVIHNAIDLKTSLPRRRENKKVYCVLSFGRLVSWKKYEEIIEAVKRINQRGKIKVKLTIFGDGPEKESLKKLGGGLLTLLPAKTHQETLKLLRQADVYVLNSLYEGSPNQVIEAFSVGTPVVATDVPGTNEVAIADKTALTVRPGDTAALSLAIEKILTDNNLAKKLARNGLSLIKAQFSWSSALRKIESQLGEIRST